MKLVPPERGKNAFHCPYPACGVCAKQSWTYVYWLRAQPNQYTQVPDIVLAVCDHCNKFSVWIDGKLEFPTTWTAPAPHPEMPVGVRTDFEEARAVFGGSPRSSAALLRLVIQKICIELGQSGKNLNQDIGNLVAEGMPVRIQQALDIVRVVGNNQVHPGVLDVRDDTAMATTLFELVNLIVEDRIAGPKQIDALYGKLPENARKQIEERDAKAKIPGG
jgi:hypothetical protein